MYPFGPDLIYPRQQWYIGAMSEEVGRDLLERKILDTLVVFYRKQDGTAVAINGLCPHRLFPLAQSRLVNDEVVCGYHGFTYNAQGRCTAIPGQANVPASFGTTAYPIVEKPPYIWIWTGNPDQVDETLLPDYDVAGIGGDMHTLAWRPKPMKARYALLVENLFDLTHFNFIHAVGAEAAAIYETKIEISETPRCLTAARITPREAVTPFDRMLRGDEIVDALPEPFLDIYGATRMYGPGLIMTGLKAFHAGHMDDPAHLVGTTYFLHGITPETATSTHYFSGFCRDFRFDDPAYDAFQAQLTDQVINEDIAALEAIEARIPLDRDLSHEISARADNGGLRARRRLQQMIRAEMAEPAQLGSTLVEAAAAE